MKKQTSILISALLILALALIGVMLVRMRPVPTQETDPGSAEPPTQSETAGQKYADATGTAAPELSEHALAAERKPEADPKAEPETAARQELLKDAEPVSEPTGEEPLPEPTASLMPLREISLSEDDLPEELLLPAEHAGTVTWEVYGTRDMVSDLPYPIDKDVMVYLPYGYDPGVKYNVLILLHCAWADHRFWLDEYRNYGTEYEPVPVSVPNLLDRMIEEGYCEPLIVVSPCIYLYDRQPSNAGNSYDYTQFSRDVGAYFLPWIVENYSTYAADGSRDSLREARDHFGVLGASFGAWTIYLSLIGDNFDLLSWYTMCGGGEIDPGYLLNSWLNAGSADLSLRLLYVCEGEFDDRYGPEISCQNLLKLGGTFTEENVKYTMVKGWGHQDHSYLVGLYNTLQMFFREQKN